MCQRVGHTLQSTMGTANQLWSVYTHVYYQLWTCSWTLQAWVMLQLCFRNFSSSIRNTLLTGARLRFQIELQIGDKGTPILYTPTNARTQYVKKIHYNLAAAIRKNNNNVGFVPREISKFSCTSFLQRSGSEVTCIVGGDRKEGLGGSHVYLHLQRKMKHLDRSLSWELVVTSPNLKEVASNHPV